METQEKVSPNEITNNMDRMENTLDKFFKFDENVEDNKLLDVDDNESDNTETEDFSSENSESDSENTIEDFEIIEEESDSRYVTLARIATDLFEMEIDESADYSDDEEGAKKLITDIAFASLPKYEQQVLQDLRAGVTLETIKEVEKSQNILDSLDLDDVEDQKKLVGAYLADQKLSQKAVKAAIDSYEVDDELADEAQNAYDYYVNQLADQKTRDIQETERLHIAQEESYNNTVRGVSSHLESLDEIHGFETTQKEKQKIMNFLFQPIDKRGATEWTRLLENPENCAELAHFAVNGGNFKNRAITQETRKISKLIKDTTTSQGSKLQNNETKLKASDLLPSSFYSKKR